MKNNLKLVTTETFGNVPCNFYRNMNDDILLTREQIGDALEYSNPIKAIRKIHNSHKDRLDDLCLRYKLEGIPQTGANLTKSEEQERVYYTQRGVMEICRWSRQPRANQFMDWTWNIIDAYRNNELGQIDSKALINAISSISNAITALTENMNMMRNDIDTIKESQTKKQLPQRKYSRWKTNTFNKLNLLLSYVNENTDEYLKLSEIIHLVISETEDIYAIELNDYVDAYKSEYGLTEQPYAIDVINHYKDTREMFTLTLDGILERLHIQPTGGKKYTTTIFDGLAAKLASETTETNNQNRE